MALPGGPGPAGAIVQHHHRTGGPPAPHPPTQPQTRARAQDPRKASAFDVFKFSVKCVSLRVSYCSYNGQHCYHLRSSKHPFLADTRPLGRLRDPTGLPRRPRSPSQPPPLLMSPNLPVHPASCRLPGRVHSISIPGAHEQLAGTCHRGGKASGAGRALLRLRSEPPYPVLMPSWALGFHGSTRPCRAC